jgi:hypothetical protein
MGPFHGECERRGDFVVIGEREERIGSDVAGVGGLLFTALVARWAFDCRSADFGSALGLFRFCFWQMGESHKNG